MTFSADLREAAVDLLTAYATEASIRLQVYRGRPASIYAPTAFVDSISERVEFVGPTLYQRRPSVEVIVLHAIFDSGEAADQRDAFVDGFIAYAASQYHAAGANTVVGVVGVDDVPAYVPDWLPPEKQKVYYASRITLEGLSQT